MGNFIAKDPCSVIPPLRRIELLVRYQIALGIRDYIREYPANPPCPYGNHKGSIGSSEGNRPCAARHVLGRPNIQEIFARPKDLLRLRDQAIERKYIDLYKGRILTRGEILSIKNVAFFSPPSARRRNIKVLCTLDVMGLWDTKGIFTIVEPASENPDRNYPPPDDPIAAATCRPAN